MRKFILTIIIIACLCIPTLAGCSNAYVTLHGNNSGNALYYTEVESNGVYTCSVTAEMSIAVAQAIEKEVFAQVFAQVVRNELFAAATQETYSDLVFAMDGSYRLTSPTKGWGFQATCGMSGLSYFVDAMVTIEGTRQDYLDYLEMGAKNALGVQSFYLHRNATNYIEESRGLYDVSGFKVPLPISSWFRDFEGSYSGNGVLAPLWQTEVQATTLATVMPIEVFERWVETIQLSYLHGSDIFNGGSGETQRLLGGMKVLEWTAVYKESMSKYQDGIELTRRTQKTWAFALIGFGATAVFAGLLYLVFRFVKKKPKPDTPFDPFGGRAQSPTPPPNVDPFGSDYTDIK